MSNKIELVDVAVTPNYDETNYNSSDSSVVSQSTQVFYGHKATDDSYGVVKLSEIKTDVDEKIEEHNASLTAHPAIRNRVNSLEDRMDDAESDIETLEDDVNDLEDSITDIKSDIGNMSSLETESDTLVGAINEVKEIAEEGGRLDEKVDKYSTYQYQDVYTNTGSILNNNGEINLKSQTTLAGGENTNINMKPGSINIEARTPTPPVTETTKVGYINMDNTKILIGVGINSNNPDIVIKEDGLKIRKNNSYKEIATEDEIENLQEQIDNIDVSEQIEEHNQDVNAHTAIQGRITTIEGKIPDQATSTNKLADKAFVNSTVQTATANFRGNWMNWAAVPIDPEEYPEDYTGETTPSTNDYMVVQDASGYGDHLKVGTWRFKYTGVWSTDGRNGWQPEYQVNETPLTAAQLAALNSGATEDLIEQITRNEDAISALDATKADDESVVHLTGNETIAGEKTFSNGIKTNSIAPVTDNGLTLYSKSGIALFKLQDNHLDPAINSARDLGSSSVRWRDLFLSRNARIEGNITDGTNAISVQEIVDLQDEKLDKEVTQTSEDEETTVNLENNGQDFEVRITENGSVDKTIAITKDGLEFVDNETGDYFAPKINGEEITGITEIELEGESGTLTDDEIAKVLSNPSAVVFNLDGKKYIHNEDAVNYVTYSNITYPTTTTQEITVIYVNTSSQAVNYKHWNVESEVPASGVAIDDDSITENTDGEIQAVKLKNGGAKVSSSAITFGDFDGIVHFENDSDFQTFVSQGYITKGGVTINYDENGFYTTPGGAVAIDGESITENDDGEIQAEGVIDQNTGNANKEWTGTKAQFDAIQTKDTNTLYYITDDDDIKKYEHSINVVDGMTPYGVWNYSFDFFNDENIPYTTLADVGTALYDTYGTAKRKASGTYVDTNQKTYLVTSVRGTSNNMVEIEYVKLEDGSINTATSGLLTVTDVVI